MLEPPSFNSPQDYSDPLVEMERELDRAKADASNAWEMVEHSSRADRSEGAYMALAWVVAMQMWYQSGCKGHQPRLEL